MYAAEKATAALMYLAADAPLAERLENSYIHALIRLVSDQDLGGDEDLQKQARDLQAVFGDQDVSVTLSGLSTQELEDLAEKIVEHCVELIEAYGRANPNE